MDTRIRSRRRRNWLSIAALIVPLVLALGVTAAYAALGTHDTATGTGALANEDTGDANTADGYNALNANTTGFNNTAVGYFALQANVGGTDNTATGLRALESNVSGAGNVATGEGALADNKGNSNTAAGTGALQHTTTADGNTAAGRSALLENTTGGFNTALGYQAGYGSHPNTVGSDNTFIGHLAAPGTDAEIDNATAVGAHATVSQSDSLVLGAAGVNVGIDTTTPQSRLQIGSGPTATWGSYLQVPVVTATDKTPPAADCNATTFVGRMVLQQVKTKKITLWACSPRGVWVKV